MGGTKCWPIYDNEDLMGAPGYGDKGGGEHSPYRSMPKDKIKIPSIYGWPYRSMKKDEIKIPRLKRDWLPYLILGIMSFLAGGMLVNRYVKTKTVIVEKIVYPHLCYDAVIAIRDQQYCPHPDQKITILNDGWFACSCSYK